MGIDEPCEDCAAGRHEKCDGEAWNKEFECVVNCACPVCSR